MKEINDTVLQEFLLVGFGGGPQHQFSLLIFFTILYILTLAENMTVVVIVLLDTHLARLPMYIFLSNFSWLEVCYVTTTVPRMLMDLASFPGTISFQACFLQFYIFSSLGCTEFFFLSAMALDHYLAICHPLRYPYIMTPNSCYALVGGCWVISFLLYTVPVILMSKLSFCGSCIINHFVCDPGPILSLACPSLKKLFLHCLFTMNAAVIIINLLSVVLSYGAVIHGLMRTSRKINHRKAFSTVSFHLVVVTLFCGPVAGMYITLNGQGESYVTKVVTVFYTAITPFLNPLIYCLRNDQVREVLGRLKKRKVRLLSLNATMSKEEGWRKSSEENPQKEQSTYQRGKTNCLNSE